MTRQKILLLQLEFSTWAMARPWSYGANFAVRDGLLANGVECVTVPVMAEIPCSSQASWVSHARTILAGKRFDQVWVWLVHTPLDTATLEWIATLAPVRIGILMESLCYDEQDYVWAPHLRHRQAQVEQQIRYMTHVLAQDERDADEINEYGTAKALWWPTVVPERFIVEPSAPSVQQKAVFHGTPYGPRRDWVTHPQLMERMAFANPASPLTKPQQLFDRLQQENARVLRRPGGATEAALADYAQELQKIREQEFAEWMAALPQWPAIVNLPSLAKFYGGRVFEGIAAGRPVVSWRIPDHPQNLALFEDGKEILLFSPDSPEALGQHLDHVLRDRQFAETLARNARKKMKQYHTAERRLHQTLRWLDTGLQPDYARTCGVSSVEPNKAQHQPLTHIAPVASLITALEDNVDSIVKKGRACQSSGNLEQAWEYFEQALAKNPGSQEALDPIVSVGVSLKRIDQLIPILSNFVTCVPGDFSARLLLATIHAKLGHLSAAREEYEVLQRMSSGHEALRPLRDALIQPSPRSRTAI